FVPFRLRCIKLINGSATISTLPRCWAKLSILEKPRNRMMNTTKPLFSITFTVLRAVTVFILFTTAAWAGVVPPYFLFVPNRLCTLYFAGIFYRGPATGSHKFGLGCLYPCLLPRCRSCLAHILGLLLGDLPFEQETNNVFVHLD